MIEKYLVRMDLMTLAMKYDVDSQEIQLGGNFKFRQNMEAVAKEGFNRPRFKTVATQKNKIRLIFKRNNREFDLAIQMLREYGYMIEKVNTLGTIMR